MTVSHTLVIWCLTIGALIIAGWRAWYRFRPLLHAQPLNRTDQPWVRLKGVFGDVGLHRRLLKFSYSGVLHLMIFISFLVLFTAIIQAFGSGLFPGFSLEPIGGETWIALLQEIFAGVMFLGVGMAVWQRYVKKPERFKGSKKSDATIIYVLIIAIVVTMLFEFGSQIAFKGGQYNQFRPISSFIASILVNFGVIDSIAQTTAVFFYWAHVLAILAFLIYIPGSKHRHMFTVMPNIFFRPLTPKGALPAPPVDLVEEGKSKTVEKFEDFTWKDLFDTLSCTECGRCQHVCPAHASGSPLSPKTLIMDLRDGLLTDEGLMDAAYSLPIAGGTIKEETLWSCTTCRACMEVCPVHIEHVPKIVQLRRSLVERGEIEPMLQTTLTSFQSHGNSFGKPAKQRARWTKGLSFKIKDARKQAVDILWFVGDFASFDPRVQKLTLALGELLHKAGVDFGILFDGEHNSGNDVRRTGDEGLFEMLAHHNINELDSCEFNRILTSDPHTLNALGSEYRSLGANYKVVHYSQFLWELVNEGKLKIKNTSSNTVTYHDPCYLGRYNGGFDSPRNLITSLGYQLHDMGRCRENSFCCGAGGGRIWMDDSGMEERPSENRIKEALALGDVDQFIVACPKDVVMYNAAVQTLGMEEKIIVRDLTELVTAAIDDSP